MVVDEAREKGDTTGFDAIKMKFCDMMKAGIIDPAKVVRCTVQNAGSIASLMLTTETFVTDLKESEEKKGKAIEGAVT